MERVKLRTRLGRKFNYPYGVGFPLWLINLMFQRLFRLDSECSVNKNFTSRVLHPQGLKIENNCLKVRVSFAVSGGCYINCADGLWIGEGTIWAPNVSIVSQTHNVADFDDAPRTDGIKIGRDCWIGAGSVILPGVTLGDHVIVGANSVVRQSFPDGNVLVAGAPARVIRELLPGEV